MRVNGQTGILNPEKKKVIISIKADFTWKKKTHQRGNYYYQ